MSGWLGIALRRTSPEYASQPIISSDEQNPTPFRILSPNKDKVVYCIRLELEQGGYWNAALLKLEKEDLIDLEFIIVSSDKLSRTLFVLFDF